MKLNRLRSQGFTLIELMVTLVIVVVLMSVAVPSFTAFVRNSELTSLSNTMLAGINAARGEAMKRGRNAMVVPINGVNWSSGWIVFVDVDRSGTYIATSTDISVLTAEAPSSFLTITPTSGSSADGSTPYMMFDASGYSKLKSGGFGALTFTIARNDVVSGDYSQTRRVVIASSGRVKVCTPVSAADANCPA